jgi:quercetin dioxygenase-like cupin family protein
MVTYNKDIKSLDLGMGVSRKVLAHGKDMMAVEVSFEKGSIGTLHTHPHVQISYVLEGKFEVSLGGEKKIIEKGDTYYTVPNLEHGVLCLEKGVLLDVFTPEREDFL